MKRAITSNSSCIALLRLDGGQVLLPDPIGWSQLRQDPHIDGISIGVQNHTWRLLDFVNQHQDLRLALISPGPNAKKWLPCVLLKAEDRFQRVQIEHVKCAICGWTGYTANPTIPDLYLGIPNYFALIDTAMNLPTKTCPKCTKNLPRHVIWISKCENQ